MTSRETVYRTLDMDSPRRIHRPSWILPWAEMHHPGEFKEIKKNFTDELLSVDISEVNAFCASMDCFVIGDLDDVNKLKPLDIEKNGWMKVWIEATKILTIEGSRSRYGYLRRKQRYCGSG